MKNSTILKFRYLFLLFGISFFIFQLNAQTDLNNDGLPHQIDFSGNYIDYQIPANPPQNHIEFFLDGGDGGMHTGCDAKGGQGARVTAVFKIGTGTGELRPGGIVRFLVGERGGNRAGSSARGGAGAGGGTAILYRRANSNADLGPEPFLGYSVQGWAILAVAGGGGGGYAGRSSANVCQSVKGGDGGTITTSGTSGGGTNDGGTNGNGGESGMDAGEMDGGAGGGYLSRGGFTSGNGRAGSISGGAGGYLIDGGQPIAEAQGGWGYGGGGAGQRTNNGGGGGGGGYSGGGGGNNGSGGAQNGGGGGSFVNTAAIDLYTIIDGNDKTSNPDHGYIRYTFRSLPGPIVVCKDIEITPPDNISPSDVMDVYGVEPFNALINITFANSGPVTPFPQNFNCTDLGPNLVTIKITSSSGATAQCTSTVTVKPTVEVACTESTIQAPVGPDAPFSLTPNLVGTVTADDCGAVLSTSLSQSTFTCHDIGVITEVTFDALDAGGFTTSCTANINIFNVDDSEALFCPDNLVTSTDMDACTKSLAAEMLPSYTARCDASLDYQIDIAGSALPITGSGEPSPIAFPLGTSNISYTLTGPDNSSQSCSFTITVNDDVPPVAACRNAVIQYSDVFNDYIPFVNDGSSDNCNIAQISLSQNSFGCAEVGDNEVTLTVVDDAGNTSTCSATVTVEDDPAPLTITCPDNIVTTVDQGSCSKLLTSGFTPSWSGTCSDMLSYEITPANADPSDPLISGMGEITSFNFASGTSTVEYTITTGDNQTASCSFTVMVEDNIAPVASCKNATVQIETPISNFVSLIDNNSTDNCELASLTTSDLGIHCDNIGANEVILTATDESGNSSTCLATVIIRESTPPTALCQDATVQLDGTGNGTLTVNEIDNGSSDDCSGMAFLDLNQEAFDCTELGENTVTLTATDLSGNTATCTATVTVEDNIAPVANCQDITVGLSTSPITLDEVDNGSSDNCTAADQLLLIFSAPGTDGPGGPFFLLSCEDIGETILQLNVVDNLYNYNSCLASITVVDDLPPIANCMDNVIALPLDASGQATLTVEDVDDNSYDVCELGPLSLNQTAFNCSNIGLNSVVLTASDAAGNTNTCTATVEVIDNTPPTAQCQDVTVNLDENGLGSLSANEVDDGSSDVCSTIGLGLSQTDFDCGNVGNDSVILTVADDAGNTSTCTAAISVEDNIPPVINCKDITVQLGQNGTKVFNNSSVKDGPITDACGLSSNPSVSFLLTCEDVGTFIQPIFAQDQNSNLSSCTGTVTVEDNVPPTALCQDITVVLDATGEATISQEDIDNGSSDACGIATMTLDETNVNCSFISGSEVTLTVTDNNGNTASCQGVVTAIDDISPVVSCQDVTLTLEWQDGELDVYQYAHDAVLDSASDACLRPTRPSENLEADCNDIGSFVQTVTVQDEAGNTASCSGTITIQELTPPEAICQDITVMLDGMESASITPDDIDNGSSDACGIASKSLNQINFDCEDIAGTVVVLTVTDNNANTATCTANVQVEGLPCGWTVDQINCSQNPKAGYDAQTGTFVLNAENCYDPNYYSNSDAQSMIQQELCGDGEIIAQVADIEGNAWAGIFMRESNDAAARMLQLAVSNNGLAQRKLRTSTGGYAFNHVFQNQGKYWLRLTRSGNQFGAYLSLDGVSWDAVLITNIPTTNCIQVGLFVSNTTPGNLAIAWFDNVQIISPTSGNTLQEFNEQLAIGNHQPSFINHQSSNNNDQHLMTDTQYPNPTDFQVYPNPTSGALNLELQAFLGQAIEIQLFNQSGQMQFSKGYDESHGSLEKIWLEHLPGGIYLLRVKAGTTYFTKKVSLLR